jgi:zinc transporter, ZIP family
MATTRPFRWPRRVRWGGLRGHMLAAFCLLMGLVVGLVAIGCAPRSAASQPTPALSESVEVVQTVLCPGTMVFQLRNDGAQPVTIAQVSVNDAFWAFTARPRATIAPHGTASVTVRYPWNAGVAYEVQFITSTGATYVTDIDASTTASAPPCP